MHYFSSKALLTFSAVGIIAVAMWFSPGQQSQAAGTTYYVSTSGSDSNSCSAAQNPSTAKASPTEGMKCLSAGDTLLIAPGTYGGATTGHYIAGNRSGTSWDNPITVRGSDPSNRPVLRAYLSTWDSADNVLADSHYWVFQDLIVDAGNESTYGYNAIGVADGMKLVNVWARNATHSNITSWIGDAPRGRYFINVEASGASKAPGGHCPPYGSDSGGTCHGMYIAGPNITVDGGSFHDNEGAGIHPHSTEIGTQSISISNARFYNNGVEGLFLTFGSGTHRIFNNLFYNNHDSQYGWGATGFVAHASGNVELYNNTFYDNDNGVSVSGGTNMTARNNIFYNTGEAFSFAQGGGPLTQSNNLTSDPRFVNPAANDFHLQSSSPAINAGMTLPEVPCDFDGNRRPGGSAYDIGAFEYGSSPSTDCPKGTTGGPTPTPPPTPTPLPPPAITLTATPSSLSIAGQGTQLFWTVQNATSCNASGGWSGAKDPGGGTERYTPTQSTTYVLTCTGSGGTSQKSVTVTLGASQSCTRYQSGSTIPQGFGVPWDVTNPASLLLKADCTPPTVVLKVGDNSNLTYVYKTGYAAPAGATSWSAVDLFGGTLISQAWYVGFAQGIAQIQSLTNPAYYVGYTCKWTPSTSSGQAGRWKCGCRDTACAQSYWQIQRLQQ